MQSNTFTNIPPDTDGKIKAMQYTGTAENNVEILKMVGGDSTVDKKWPKSPVLRMGNKNAYIGDVVYIKDGEPHVAVKTSVHVISDEKVTPSAIAMNIIRESMMKDEGYAWAWHCNVAVLMIDEGINHKNANERAAGFMKMAFGVDTSKCSQYKAAEKNWDKRIITL